ncbi:MULTISPECIES: hypothetical protein [Shewanella]|jgi:cell division protein FtsB|uniref:Phage shock protein B n=1 Tax=Shewanella baltica (strain OS195) TaxID=399599 RepID=A9L3T1_SHEB9|nr:MULTISPECIES: hypothetical protein [Shewanella]ABS09863.1 conserved hypothetical protein [Shewanella baltica OS185]ABX51025.1 conserved hypothetical protein [Shewanella baltica OS195]ACK48160.1 conserved hypothetical protein [Shewanella baltica OS223]ADT96025.1 hypothetical protein Sbal678_3895 [Shewanella baltica OS678]AEG12886.1 hypothetical protein Sbal175_3660 [Shewanella baltica BA175]
MNTGALALLIPILAIVGGYVVAIMKIRDKQGVSSREQEAENQALRAELATLRQRVEVLEQLVTDDSFQLKREFKQV